MTKARHRRPPARQRHRTLLGVTALVWAAVFAVAFAGKVKLAARAPTQIALTTWPPAVRVAIDGEKQNGGAYVATPTKFSLAPGRHKLTLARDGYFAQTSEIDDVTGRTIEMTNVVLQKNGAMTFTPVQIERKDDAGADVAVGYVVDDGFVAGETPALLDDLQADQPHFLTLFPAGQDAKTSRFRCRFTPPAVEPGAPPYVLAIRPAGTSGAAFKVTNCTKVNKPKR
jgi:hypothetical protein